MPLILGQKKSYIVPSIVDKLAYRPIGIITHMGTADAGHNRTYLKHEMKWYLCEDDKYPIEKRPFDKPAEQSYCVLLKKCPQRNICVPQPSLMVNLPRLTTTV